MSFSIRLYVLLLLCSLCLSTCVNSIADLEPNPFENGIPDNLVTITGHTYVQDELRVEFTIDSDFFNLENDEIDGLAVFVNNSFRFTITNPEQNYFVLMNFFPFNAPVCFRFAFVRNNPEPEYSNKTDTQCVSP